MGNLVTNRGVAGLVPLDMSNGLTAVVFDVLAIAGCDLAVSRWEKSLAYWLVQHDQSRIGLGVVGFDVEEMGWTAEGFDEQRRFVLGIIDAARARRGWERLPFSPREESVAGALERLRGLVVAFTRDLVRAQPEGSWIPDELPEHGACERHRVYLHELGCIICNDTPVITR